MINKNKLLEKSIENNTLEIEIKYTYSYVIDELFNHLEVYINDNKQITYKHLTASSYAKSTIEKSHNAKNRNNSIENAYMNNNLEKQIYFMILINDKSSINTKLTNLREDIYYK